MSGIIETTTGGSRGSIFLFSYRFKRVTTIAIEDKIMTHKVNGRGVICMVVDDRTVQFQRSPKSNQSVQQIESSALRPP